ncbi:PD-(D/E)XK nuclease family protein [Uliginosibacterium sp. 31-16]|uniref:PD-(D/E)XK nuclease family protein n=1 Tax=Uliginosibacterium sp. 31-16 TaxID=3068315 RepID=UPI00273EEC49|nr:PD-(D/E)XK nuclease family protein [Uliginosibacterium sp. 31-16]MDP5239987.1 PD-(D/E)XK nuclease family protein [Uliginosibacterium sp. 31-16]
MTLAVNSLAPDSSFLPACAAHILAFARPAPLSSDLSRASLLLPNLKLAPALNQALLACAGGPLLLPRSNTLSGMIEPWLAAQQPMPDARRQLILHALLRGRPGLDDGMLWDVVAELTRLFDTLTEHAVKLPDDEATLLARLETAFELKNSQPLNFEASIVNTLWRAESTGENSHAVARLLAAAQWIAQLDGPLIVMLESAEAGPLQALIEAAALRVPVLVLRPDRALAEGALPELLLRAWPLEGAQPLRERLAGFTPAQLDAARQRLQLVAAESLETLGEAVADQVLDWICAGKQQIALIACDRLAARRARALLEREGVLVQDETGWKMVTTRVAAVVDAWLEVLASNAWHRALIDLLRAPLLFADLDPLVRAQGVDALDRLIRESGMSNGLERLCALARKDAPAAVPLLERLIAASAVINPQQQASIADWLRRLLKSLELLGALPHFTQDQVGRKWLEWLEARTAELSAEQGSFRFAAWRTWFNRQMDAELYRDESIDSPVIMTHLAATRLRSFDAAIVIGADTEHLAPPAAPGWLTHAGVRRELGLPGLDAERRQLREDLAGLLLASDESVIAWQSLRRDEALMPAAEVAVLEAALGLAVEGWVVKKAVARGCPASAEIEPTRVPAPSIPSGRVPERLSASGLKALIDCPYRYFARYVLRLAELDELTEGMEKKDFGEQLHAILHRFHSEHPRLQAETDEVLLAALEAITEDAFAEAVSRNFQDHAWRLRWRAQLADYLAWQRAREAEGWHWQAGEVDAAREHELGAGRSLQLIGRIDRVDTRADGEQALLDYKSRGLKLLRDQVKDPDDVQLAFYTLLQGTRIAEAAYVALDGNELGAAPLDAPEERAAALQDCITESFNALHAGAGLPAQGTAGACQYCEMRGLCRKEWTE